MAGIFYGYLLITAVVALAARRVERLRKFLERTIWADSTINVAELAWFIGMNILIYPVFLWAVWDMYWANELNKMGRNGSTTPWVSYFYEALTYISGAMCAGVIGFLLMPTPKNSVIADYLRLPYTATVRMHRWMGWNIVFISVVHTVISMLWKANDATPLYQL
ncbi:hypothetical protein HDU93_006437, partial [Gonapodya sp. JEL0774]